ncbi:hypothetical protein WJX72_006287 [[Myrmecia] bisecta]|uniref:Uncharacterized protein n=1 Tax=[Myrmecia] bisecta TaxID=41462 RepID=A0AAW1Q5H0_9CHLO
MAKFSGPCEADLAVYEAGGWGHQQMSVLGNDKTGHTFGCPDSLLGRPLGEGNVCSGLVTRSLHEYLKHLHLHATADGSCVGYVFLVNGSEQPIKQPPVGFWAIKDSQQNVGYIVAWALPASPRMSPLEASSPHDAAWITRALSIHDEYRQLVTDMTGAMQELCAYATEIQELLDVSKSLDKLLSAKTWQEVVAARDGLPEEHQLPRNDARIAELKAALAVCIA